jgi:hypothetical protein
MEAASTSEISVNFCQITRRNILEDSHLHNRRHQNLKSHKLNFYAVVKFKASTCSVSCHFLFGRRRSYWLRTILGRMNAIVAGSNRGWCVFISYHWHRNYGNSRPTLCVWHRLALWRMKRDRTEKCCWEIHAQGFLWKIPVAKIIRYTSPFYKVFWTTFVVMWTTFVSVASLIS